MFNILMLRAFQGLLTDCSYLGKYHNDDAELIVRLALSLSYMAT